MYFIKINNDIIEYTFTDKKEALLYIVDYLERQNFDDPVDMLKKSERIRGDDYDILKTDESTFMIFVMYEYRSCVICKEEMSSKYELDCKQNVCSVCINNLRKNECPVCKKELSGYIMTDEILCNILQRTEIDEQERLDRDQLMAIATHLGYNPNELY